MKIFHPIVLIENWPNAPIELESAPKVIRRVTGVFLVSYNKSFIAPQPLPLFRGCGHYFQNTREASAAAGYRGDQVGKVLRKNKGGRQDGYANLKGNVFVSAEKALATRRDLDRFLKAEFPWLYDKKGALISHRD